jgi:AcrR family transcriptional regulator
MPDSAAHPPATRTRFHHGDLRAQALAGARDMVAQHGVDKLVLRELASSLGVNHRALYRHFPDKQALILQLSAMELDALVTGMQAVLPADGASGQARIMMEVYVGYALEQPRLYEMVFSLPLRDDVDGDTAVGAQVKRLIRLAAKVFHQPGDTPALTRDRVIRAWGTAHGLALLVRRGALHAGSRIDVQRYIVDAAVGLQSP